MTLPSGPWIELEEIDSTQRVARERLEAGEAVGVVFTKHQTQGRGRFGRVWVSERGDSLTYSLVFDGYADHSRAYLIGMAVAVAVAETIGCELRWPNDLTFGGKKVGGILTEVIRDAEGRLVPVVGVGINLNQTEFPLELALTATSLLIECGEKTSARMLGDAILASIGALPKPTDWSVLQPLWTRFDRTEGKHYKLPDGRVAVAQYVGDNAELHALVDGQPQVIVAAEAVFGP